jgi:hypothetical protein
MIATDRKVLVTVTDAETGELVAHRTVQDDYLLITSGDWQVETFTARMDRHTLTIASSTATKMDAA